MIAALAIVLLQSASLPKCDLSQCLITSRSVGPLRLGEAVRALVANVHGGSVIAFVFHGRVDAFRLTTGWWPVITSRACCSPSPVGAESALSCPTGDRRHSSPMKPPCG